MRAAFYTRTGSAVDVLCLGEQPTPKPGPLEVLVCIHASGINPADVKRRAGWNGATMAHPLVIPHCDGAGIIEEVGANVDTTRIGQRVWLWNAQGGYGEAGRAFGTAAQYIVLPSDQAVPLPDAVDFAQGACLGVPALTAWLAVLADDAVEDQWVLIQGAAGAVGQMCVQVALAHGARVLATVSTVQGATAVQKLGDVTVINRHDCDVSAAVMEATANKGAARIIEVDLAANIDTDLACLSPNGMIASYSSSSDPTPTFPYYAFADLGARLRFVQGFRLTPSQRTTAQESIASMIRQNRLAPQIGATYPLDDIAAAHARVEHGALGQTVLTLSATQRS